MEPEDISELPKPFYRRPWPSGKRDVAQALWDWHRGLPHWIQGVVNGSDAPAACQTLANQLTAASQPDFVAAPLWSTLSDGMSEYDLSHQHLASQVRVAHRLIGPMRFETKADLVEFVQAYPIAHGRLLAELADLTYSWQKRPVRELARAFFYTGMLARLPYDLARDRLFIPLDALAEAEVTVEELRQGALNRNVTNLLWKYLVLARDAFGQGQELVKDLSWRYRGTFKRAWLGGLEILHLIEDREFNIWEEPVELTLRRKLQIVLQALFGRISFQTR